MIVLKQGVVLAGIDEVNIFEVICEADGIWKENSWGPVVVTSGIEGTHLPNSSHYKGHAVDLRSPENVDRAVAILEERLFGWKVIKEDNHIHVQFIPKV
jgi:hypothetical protein